MQNAFSTYTSALRSSSRSQKTQPSCFIPASSLLNEVEARPAGGPFLRRSMSSWDMVGTDPDMSRRVMSAWRWLLECDVLDAVQLELEAVPEAGTVARHVEAIVRRVDGDVGIVGRDGDCDAGRQATAGLVPGRARIVRDEERRPGVDEREHGRARGDS